MITGFPAGDYAYYDETMTVYDQPDRPDAFMKAQNCDILLLR